MKYYKLRYSLIAFWVLMGLTGCGWSEVEKQLIYPCIDSGGSADAYLEDGTHYSKSEEGKRAVILVCYAKTRLYLEGHRIAPVFNASDIRFYRNSRLSDSSLKSMYKRAIRDGEIN